MKESDDSLLLMLSVEESQVVFVLINPFFLCPDYSPRLAPEELSCLQSSAVGRMTTWKTRLI